MLTSAELPMCYMRQMDQAMFLKHLETAERHVVEATQDVTRQREIIDVLARGGCSTDAALALLGDFERAMADRVAACEGLRRELRRA